MTDPNIIHSGLSQHTTIEGVIFKVEIYRLEHESKWSLEVVDEDGTSTVWDDLFDTDQAAFDEVMSAIKEEGLSAFRDTNIVQFPQ
jgi:hypothetical protein